MKRNLSMFLLCIVLFFSAASLWASPGEKQLFQEAEGRFKTGDYELALDRYNEFITLYPLSEFIADIQFRRGVCLYQVGKSEEALYLFNKIEERYVTTHFINFVPFWRGVVRYSRQEFAGAVQDFQSFIDTGEESLVQQALLYKAMAHRELQEEDLAVSALESLVQKESPDPFALTLLCSLYAKAGQFEEIDTLLTGQAAAEYPAAWADWLNLYQAESHWSFNRLEDAVAIYEDLLDAAPEVSSLAYQRLFSYHEALGNSERLSELVSAAESELNNFPQILSEFWLRIGIESYQAGKHDLALSYFYRIWRRGYYESMSGLVPLYLAELLVLDQQADDAGEIINTFLVQSDSHRESLLYMLGNLHMRQRDWASAESIFDEFLKEFAASNLAGNASYLHAYALYKQESYREALIAVAKSEEKGIGGESRSKLLRLKADLLRLTGDTAEAVTALREYLPVNSTDTGAAVELLKLYFAREDFATLLTESEKYESVIQESGSDNDRILYNYLYGLALITGRQYEEALTRLETLTPEQVQAAGLDIIYPYSLFYQGWSLYRMAEYQRAENLFTKLSEDYPVHDLTPRSYYLGGWCAFTRGDYSKAEQLFEKYSHLAFQDDTDKGIFMYARSLMGQERYDDAYNVLGVIADKRNNPFADDALFEQAQILNRKDDEEGSVQRFRDLYDAYPRSPLAEEGMFKRGEILYSAGNFKGARAAFYEHRLAYPSGLLFDASLYWGGLAAHQLGEDFGAVLLWEKLVNDYSSSSFRSEALVRSAEIYEAQGKIDEASAFYRLLMVDYPDEAASIQADARIQKLLYIKAGQGEREAELSVIIGNSNGAETENGRQAILELAQLYLYSSQTQSRRDLAAAMLEGVIAKKETAPAAAARAQYLKAEYFYRKGEYRLAGEAFLKTATINPQDQDLIAESIYRAAQMALEGGNRQDAVVLVNKLEQTFPSSQWVIEGKKLIGGR